MTSRTVGTRLGVVEFGEQGQGPVVLALHGALGGWDQSWLLARTALEVERMRVLAVSRPGYLGTPLASGVAPEEQADLYAALLDELGVERAAVIAISGGGQSALQFGLRHAERCEALALVSACSAPMGGRMPLGFHLLRLGARWGWLRGKLTAPRPLEERLKRAVPDERQRAALRADEEALALFNEMPAVSMARIEERLDGLENDVFQSRRPFDYAFEELRMPVLALHGNADAVAPCEASRELARRAPRGELVELEGGQHVALFTHRAEIRAAVARLLAC